jgi:hypothetical protein
MAMIAKKYVLVPPDLKAHKALKAPPALKALQA